MSADLGLLLISSAGLYAYAWRNDALVFHRAFARTEPDLQAFTHYLKSEAKTRFRLLADLPDEGFQVEPIPPVGGKDRKALIARRQANAFPASPLVAALSLGHDQDGRGDERLLLASLSNPALISCWLQCCRKARTRVACLTTTPLLISRIASSAVDCQSRSLLYTLGPGGLRQTCLDQGRLQFSRLVETYSDDVSDLISACRLESRRVRYYWGGAMPETPAPASNPEPKSYIVLSDSDTGKLMAEAGADDGLHIVSLRQLEASHGVPAGDGSQCDHFLLHMLAKQPAEPDFATDELLAPIRELRWRQNILIAGAGTFAACLLAASGLGISAYLTEEETEALHVRIQSLQARQDAHVSALPPMPMPPAALRELSNAFREQERQTRSFEPIYVLISRILDRMPGLEVDRIEWRIASEPDAAGEAKALGATVTRLDMHVPSSEDKASVIERFLGSLSNIADLEAELVPTNGSSAPLPTEDQEHRFAVRLVHTAAK